MGYFWLPRPIRIYGPRINLSLLRALPDRLATTWFFLNSLTSPPKQDAYALTRPSLLIWAKDACSLIHPGRVARLGAALHRSKRWRGASQLKLRTVTTDASVCACRVLVPPASVSGLGAISAYSPGLRARAHLRPASCRTQR